MRLTLGLESWSRPVSDLEKALGSSFSGVHCRHWEGGRLFVALAHSSRVLTVVLPSLLRRQNGFVAAPIPIPGAFVAIDDTNAHTIDEAPSLNYTPASAFAQPPQAHALLLTRWCCGCVLSTRLTVVAAPVWKRRCITSPSADAHFMRVPARSTCAAAYASPLAGVHSVTQAEPLLRATAGIGWCLAFPCPINRAQSTTRLDVVKDASASTALLFSWIFLALAISRVQCPLRETARTSAAG